MMLPCIVHESVPFQNGVTSCYKLEYVTNIEYTQLLYIHVPTPVDHTLMVIIIDYAPHLIKTLLQAV